MAHYQLQGHRVVVATLVNETIRAVSGAMVAYDGQVAFKNAGMGGGEGLRGALKRRVTGESLSLMECSGHGTVYFALRAADITLIRLNGETLLVESSSLLLVDGGLRTDVKFTGLRGATTGQGLFTTSVTGQGTVGIVSDGPAVLLEVSPQFPLVVDPDAYVASMGQLNQSFVTDVTWRTVVGQGSGEAFSLRFDGSGIVYIQPAER
jgi:uncharacterized protein (AIM24 family)